MIQNESNDLWTGRVQDERFSSIRNPPTTRVVDFHNATIGYPRYLVAFLDHFIGCFYCCTGHKGAKFQVVIKQNSTGTIKSNEKRNKFY